MDIIGIGDDARETTSVDVDLPDYLQRNSNKSRKAERIALLGTWSNHPTTQGPPDSHQFSMDPNDRYLNFYLRRNS